MRPTSPFDISKYFTISLPEGPATAPVQEALVTLRTLCVLGVMIALFWWFLLGQDTIRLNPAYVTLYLTATEDTAWLLLCAIAIPLLVLSAQHPMLSSQYDAITRWAASLRHPVAVIALFSLVIMAVGARVVYHAFPLSLDEYLAWFQARTLLGGHILAPIAPGWDTFVEALQPIFMRYDHANGLWVPGYRPLGAAIIALFELVGAGVYANSFLAAGSIVLIALVAKRVWPQHRYAPAVAALFLALSPQFLVTGMTAYAMTGHLFFNLLWLLFFLRNDRIGHIGATLTGFVAIGLHQVHVHPFFILPFMIYLLRERRLAILTVYTVWYAASITFWILWRDIAAAAATVGPTASALQPAEGHFFIKNIIQLLHRHNLIQDIALWTVNFTRLIGWQAPVVLIFFYLGLKTLADAPVTVRLLAWGIATTLLPYVILMPGQGHGWGYRYLHVALGSVSLIATHGLIRLNPAGRTPPELVRRLLVALIVVGAVIGIPLRLLQVEHFVRPFASAERLLNQQPEDVVIVDTDDIWFGVDLVRNDPYLTNKPKILASSALNHEALTELCANHAPGVFDYPHVARLGMRTYLASAERQRLLRERLAKRLNDAGCHQSTFR